MIRRYSKFSLYLNGIEAVVKSAQGDHNWYVNSIGSRSLIYSRDYDKTKTTAKRNGMKRAREK